MNLKGLLIGITLIIIISIGSLIYRNALEHPFQPIICPFDTEICPDGSIVSRIGTSCTFPVCPLPNVSLSNVGIAYAIPQGFAAGLLSDTASVADYQFAASTTSTTTTTSAEIIIRRYAIDASTTSLALTETTAVSGISGVPVPIVAYSSTMLNNHRFTIVPIERSKGVIDTAYYLPYNGALLRFDAVDYNVTNWTNSNFNPSILPGNQALIYLLSTLQ